MNKLEKHIENVIRDLNIIKVEAEYLFEDSIKEYDPSNKIYLALQHMKGALSLVKDRKTESK